MLVPDEDGFLLLFDGLLYQAGNVNAVAETLALLQNFANYGC
jgi:hypothetical protein